MTEQTPDQQPTPDTEAGPSPYPGDGEQAAGEDQAEENAAQDPPA